MDVGKCSTKECEAINFIATDDLIAEINNCSTIYSKLPNSEKSPKKVTETLMNETVIIDKGSEGLNSEDVLTPLTKINLRWRRKSKGLER